MLHNQHLQRTTKAVSAQIRAMGQSRYELGVHNPNGHMILRTVEHHQILASIPWLRHMNASGSQIYLRPASSLGLVLLDDLSGDKISPLRTDGLAPAVIMETSPRNYQCWIRLIRNCECRELAPNLIHHLLRQLAKHYGADPASTDWRHFGRLAGFTNQKPKHRGKDGPPFVLLHYAQPVIAPEGRNYLLRASQDQCESVPASTGSIPKKHTCFADRLSKLLEINRDQRWAAAPDYSRLDYMIAREMLAEGHRPEDVLRKLVEGSPKLHARKSGHVLDYARRTVNAAGAPFSSLSLADSSNNETHVQITSK